MIRGIIVQHARRQVPVGFFRGLSILHLQRREQLVLDVVQSAAPDTDMQRVGLQEHVNDVVRVRLPARALRIEPRERHQAPEAKRRPCLRLGRQLPQLRAQLAAVTPGKEVADDQKFFRLEVLGQHPLLKKRQLLGVVLHQGERGPQALLLPQAARWPASHRSGGAGSVPRAAGQDLAAVGAQRVEDRLDGLEIGVEKGVDLGYRSILLFLVGPLRLAYCPRGERQGNDHTERQGQEDGSEEACNHRVSLAPPPPLLEPAHGPRLDRLAALIPMQFLCQVRRQAVAFDRVFLQALQTDRFQVTGRAAVAVATAAPVGRSSLA